MSDISCETFEVWVLFITNYANRVPLVIAVLDVTEFDCVAASLNELIFAVNDFVESFGSGTSSIGLNEKLRLCTSRSYKNLGLAVTRQLLSWSEVFPLLPVGPILSSLQ